mmetsp:Transcript_2252/g.4574  ORF Transcript_2252/g.4574 Transcript_2252/m.4574 type:complete len:247 (-) Transcript_2252:63-803(-)
MVHNTGYPYTVMLGVGSGVAIGALIFCFHPAAAPSFCTPSRAAALSALPKVDSFVEPELVRNAAWCLSTAMGLLIALRGASSCGCAILRRPHHVRRWITCGLSLPLLSVPVLACLAWYHFSWSCQGIDQCFGKLIIDAMVLGVMGVVLTLWLAIVLITTLAVGMSHFDHAPAELDARTKTLGALSAGAPVGGRVNTSREGWTGGGCDGFWPRSGLRPRGRVVKQGSGRTTTVALHMPQKARATTGG